MATCRLLDELVARAAQERYDITVVGEEPGGAYNRILLSKVLDGAEPVQVVTKPPAWYAERGIRLVTNVAERLDTSERKLQLRGAEALRYDIAILATGSQRVARPRGLHRGAFRPGGHRSRVAATPLRRPHVAHPPR
jgi:nitrite reductase (NADH) large subunit